MSRQTIRTIRVPLLRRAAEGNIPCFVAEFARISCVRNSCEFRYGRFFSAARLIGIRGHNYRVRWLDGSTSKLARRDIPADMVRFRVGQPFDAVVLRDARSWKLIRIESVFAAKSLPVVSENDANEILAPKKSRANRRQLDWNS